MFLLLIHEKTYFKEVNFGRNRSIFDHSQVVSGDEIEIDFCAPAESKGDSEYSYEVTAKREGKDEKIIIASGNIKDLTK